MAKASDQNGSDGEGRKPGEQTGLDTRNLLNSKFLELARKDLLIIYKYVLRKEKIVWISSLITRVVLAVNVASKVLHILHECAVPKRRC